MTGAAAPVLLRPGSVVTGDPSAPVAEAVLIDRGLVAGVGRYDDLRATAPGAAVVDLAGCSVVPGLVESHMHPVYTAMTAGWADCRSPGRSSI
ncbi:amidohydrolase, partial [Pseudonocardia sp. KRD-291]|nr:amidohydrolase [Pseudonocardia sp. KRD291]